MTLIVEARNHTVGGMPVRRPLPTRQRRTVGPFVFLDELGPVILPVGVGMDVRPHPHIGLATLTYRLSGELIHRDSLGCTQAIRPGEVNVMTAGRGVTHSERSADSERNPACEVHGVQLWIGLEGDAEQTEPSFEHQPESALPKLRRGPVELRVLIGRAFETQAPGRVHAPIFCVDALWADDGELLLDPAHGERGVYPLIGECTLDGQHVPPGHLGVCDDEDAGRLTATAGTRLLLLGGAPRRAPLHMHWNYVASDPQRLEEAKRRWADGEFPPVVGDADSPEPDPAQAPR